ncbi:MAG: DUF1501 domain-containing protein [Planctomycetes bacterium]|nr:DUF1501 domain-containing protein [Planctomycetota bacterium]
MSLDRRSLLKAGLFGLPFAGLTSHVAALAKAVSGAAAAGSPRLLLIYQRGGADAVNMIAPLSDPDYAVFRPNISLSLGGSITQERRCIRVPGHPYAGLHLALQQLTFLPADRIAYLYRIGNASSERSHFTEQHLTETGRVVYDSTDPGWLPQVLGQSTASSTLGAVCISKRLQRIFMSTSNAVGPTSLHLQQPFSTAVGNGTIRNLTIEYGLGTPAASVATAVLNATRNGNPAYQLSGDAQYLRDTVVEASTDLNALRGPGGFPHSTRYPVPGDAPPSGSDLTSADIAAFGGFFARLEEAVHLLRGPSPLSHVVGVELGGWDTHANQLPAHARLCRVLAHAIRVAYEDLAQDAAPFLVLSISEFGRTLKDNGSGTDHGVGGLYIAAGSSVRGGLYNLHHPAWAQPQPPFAPVGQAWTRLSTQYASPTWFDAMNPVTDFRVPFIEIAKKFFNVPPATLPGVGAEWAAIDASNAPFDAELGFL